MVPEVDFLELIERVKNDDESLNTRPLHEGNYDYSFVKDGTYYHFESDGWHWNWEYYPTDGEDTI